MRTVRVTTLLVALGLAAALSVPVAAQSNVLLLVDASGSMKKSVDGGESRMDAAKRVLGETVHAMPADARLGLMAYGHRRAKDCTDIELISPIGADDAGTIAARIQALQPKGETPIAGALQQAARSFAALKGQNNAIVLVTDGIEECSGDPCAAAKAVAAAGLDLKVNIVGFTLDQKQQQEVECITRETGGRYYGAKGARELTTALTEVRQQLAQVTPTAEPPKPPAQAKAINLLGPENGGQVLVAPSDTWLGTIDGKGANFGCCPGGIGEAVYTFKDEKAATFDTFSVLIQATNAGNLKEFELLVSDDSPTGAFRSIGKFQTQNVKFIQKPYQEFKFPPVTAKYVKVKTLSNWGGNIMFIDNFQLRGTLQE